MTIVGPLRVAFPRESIRLVVSRNVAFFQNLTRRKSKIIIKANPATCSLVDFTFVKVKIQKVTVRLI